MKKTKFITMVLASLVLSVSAFAQKPDIRESFEVNGIKMGDVVNDSIIRSKLGSPTREGIIDGMFGYWFGDTFVGGIRVGDDANKVKAKIREKDEQRNT